MDDRSQWTVRQSPSPADEAGKALHNVFATDMDVDITDMYQVSRYAGSTHPNVIINCAGMTDVTECEADMVTAYKVNALGARNVAAAARMVDAKIIQVSTDDVFPENCRMR